VKIVKHTDLQLVVCEPASCIYQLIAIAHGVLFVGIPTFWILLTVANTGVMKLSCQRIIPSQIRCKQSDSVFFGLRTLAPKSYDQVLGAGLKQSQQGTRRSSTTHEIVLTTAGGSVNMIQTSNMVQEMQGTVDEINKFIESGRPALFVRHDRRFYPSVIVLLAVMGTVSGIGMFKTRLILSSDQIITFDKTAGQVTFTTGGIQQKWPLIAGITGLTVNKKTYRSGNTLYFLDMTPKADYPYHITVTPIVMKSKLCKAQFSHS
jgi:hypothetical protein